MNKEQSFDELLKEFAQPVPPEALKSIPYKAGGGLTDINAGYAIKRLRDVFGASWQYKTQVIESSTTGEENLFVVEGTLCFPEHGKEFGPMSNAHSKKDAADAIKGAQTGAFMQIVKYMGFGKEIYMGLFDANTMSYTKPMPRPYSLERIMSELEKADSLDAIKALYEKHVLYQNNPEWLEALRAKHKGLESKPASKAPAKKPSTIERALALIESATGTLTALDEVLQICADWIDDPAFIKAMQEARKKSS